MFNIFSAYHFLFKLHSFINYYFDTLWYTKLAAHQLLIAHQILACHTTDL